MAKQAVVKVTEGKTEEAIAGFLKLLLEKGVVEAILIPKGLPSGDGFVQTLIRNPGKAGWSVRPFTHHAGSICQGRLKSYDEELGQEGRGSDEGLRNQGRRRAGQIPPGQTGSPLPHRHRLSGDV